MTPPDEKDTALEAILRDRVNREQGYREKALKMYPWICGRCGREFSGKKVKELTVHHRDHNHDNNPADGSNWELLCIYCHENEHERQKVADASAAEAPRARQAKSRPIPGDFSFAGLADMMKNKKR